MATSPLPIPESTGYNHQPLALHTTLYDLIAALDAETEPDEEAIVTAAVVHILNTYKVTCTGDLHGYRMTCHATDRSAKAEPQKKSKVSHLEREIKARR